MWPMHTLCQPPNHVQKAETVQTPKTNFHLYCVDVVQYLLSTGHSSPATASTGSERPGAGVCRKGAGRGGLWVWLVIVYRCGMMRSKVQYCCQKRACHMDRDSVLSLRLKNTLIKWWKKVEGKTPLHTHDAPNLTKVDNVKTPLMLSM